MENENKKYGKARKVTGIVLSSVLLAATLVGAGFGFANSTKKVNGIDTNYNDFVQIEADVKFEKDGVDINDAARSINDTLEFLGMQNAQIRTMGDSKIIINNPIESYTETEFNINPSTSDHLDLMTETSNINYAKEVGALTIPLFFDGTLDFRDLDGEAAFVNSGVNDYQFVGGVEDGGTFGVVAETDTETASTVYTSRKFSEEYYVENFFDGAQLKHSKGLPVIELQISKEGRNGDGYINMFKDLDRYIDSTANSDNPTQYVVWFNYELTNDLVDFVDHDGLASAGSLYSYVSSKPSLRPLYVTTGTTSIMSSIYSDTVELTGSFSEQQAEYFVRRINNSSRFTYSNVNFEVVINLQTKIMLVVLASFLLLFILVVIFTFVAYFGLLGLIASAVFTLTSAIMFMLMVGTGILITGLGLVALGVVVAITAMMMFTVVKVYKNNNEDKFSSVNTVASEKLSEIHSLMFVPVVSIVLLFYGAGLVISTLIAIPLYLVVIGTVLSYGISSIVLMPLLYGMDSLVQWTRFEYTTRWDFLIGFNPEFKNNKSSNNSNVDGDSVKKKTLIGTIVAIVLLLLSVVIGGTLYGTTGSAFNSTTYGTANYSYVVQAKDDAAWLELGNESTLTGSNRFGAEFVTEYYENTNTAVSAVENVFEDNGIRVSNIEVIRIDKIDSDYEMKNKTLLGSFGFEIYSKDAINKEIATEIEKDLSALEAVVLNPNEAMAASTKYELTERMSWNGKESIKMIGYTQNNTFIYGIFAMLTMILVLSIILIVVGNWGVALATIITSLMELALIIAPFIVLYIPITSMVILPIVLLAGASFVIKTIITKRALRDEIETNKWERAANKNKFVLPIFSAFLLILELLLFGTYSFIVVLPMILITVITPFTIYLIQQFVFPFFASKLDGIKNNSTKAKLARDIEDSKNPEDGEPREEYIIGVNM